MAPRPPPPGDGDELIFLDANGDISKQNNDIQDLLTRKVDILIINAVNPDAVGASSMRQSAPKCR
jgi:ribose transport system substrate-binding protein